MKRTQLVLARRAAIAIAAGLVLYFAAAVVLGLLAVNRSFVPPSDGIEIFLVTNGIHAGLALPARVGSIDLAAALPTLNTTDKSTSDYVMVGWGDARVYPATGTLADLTPLNAVTSLLGLNGAVMHAEYGRRPITSARARSTRISTAGYGRLVAHIASSFSRDSAGRFTPVGGARHGDPGSFYLAHGRYHPFYTCNEWVRRGLAVAGVRTAMWSPFDIALFHQFPR